MFNKKNTEIPEKFSHDLSATTSQQRFISRVPRQTVYTVSDRIRDSQSAGLGSPFNSSSSGQRDPPVRTCMSTINVSLTGAGEVIYKPLVPGKNNGEFHTYLLRVIYTFLRTFEKFFYEL